MEANNRCEWIWPFYAKLLLFGYFTGNVMMSIVSVVIVRLIYGNFRVEYLYHAFRVM